MKTHTKQVIGENKTTLNETTEIEIKYILIKISNKIK